jgi:class 3 adenylate cyclase
VTSAPQTHYAKSGDVHVAYQVLGEGPLDLLFVMGLPLPMDTFHESPVPVRFLDRLTSFARVIVFDRPGLGLSDAVSPANPPTAEQLTQDAFAVLDHAGVGKVNVLGSSVSGAQIAVLMAATQPERTGAAVIVNGSARIAWAEDYTIGLETHDVPPLDARGVNWNWLATDDGIAQVMPSAAKDRAFGEWWRRSIQRGLSPGAARTFMLNRNASDVRDMLPKVTVPTLVMHRRGNRYYPVEHGRYLAGHIPSARYVELEGDDHLIFAGDQEEVLDGIEEFLTGEPGRREHDRVMATILFTDVVGSTETLAARGDRQWRDLLERHDAVVQREIDRFGGRYVESTGDGVLATFDGPGRAIRCAQAICEVVRRYGIEVRAGLHAGEIEKRGQSVAGIAVHIGQRVSALASAGEVLVSRTIVDLVTGSGIGFEDRGEHELKGVPGTWQLFAVTH